MSLILTGNSSTLTVDSTNGITFPNSTIQAVAAQTGPAFSAYNNAGQSIATSTFVKLQANTKEFDTASCFDNTTNYRFTPNVAGYYLVTAQIGFNTTVTAPQCVIYKNGSGFKNGNNMASGNWATASALIYCNGTTDYLEFYVAHVSGSTQTTLAGPQYCYFQAFLARAA